jgi:hypothetical protein
MLRLSLLLLPLLAGCMPRADLVPSQASTRMPLQVAAYPPSVLPRVNENFSGSLPFLNRNMTLPAGSWKVANVAVAANKNVGLVGAIVALVRTQGTSLQGVLVFAGNARPLPNGGPVNKLCQMSDVIWNDVRAAVPQGEQDCASVNFERTAFWRAGTNNLTTGIMTQLDLLNVQPPNIMVSVGIHEANRNWMLDEYVFENPDLAGITPDMSTQRAQSAWTAFRLPGDPAKQKFVDDLKRRAEPMRAALRRQIQAPAPYLPGTGLTPA